MEPALSSDDSCDSEMKIMKNELIEFGLEEDNLSKEEMTDLLKALKNSKSTEQEDEVARDKVNVENTDCPSPKKNMKRRYLNVRDRRLPWSLLPTTITPAEKARTLAVYIKLMSLNSYHQARQSANFAAWPPPLQIVEETTRVQPVRSTRSGRSVPVYADFDDDSSDLDFVVTKSKKRKVSTSDHNGSDGIYTNKVLSLKRKPSKDENNRPVKEPKLNTDNKLEVVSSVIPVKPKKDLFTIIED
ncbi:uncharacterized protein LOC110371659 isoform X1 [Helicoverpa armigera]|uniref:uncharacterized protein LOC110371659 isoform X1 n=1 Tax=Helicoverpa armigera TaxID=29058 RepID=UPI000B384C44|nr:uncharacterized protein LOC110371659 isoform X1 [Helicoverpa armigera]PZC82688.1 hypothetical protein B5X24_HaOG209786 [Helicoverpa armigera]